MVFRLRSSGCATAQVFLFLPSNDLLALLTCFLFLGQQHTEYITREHAGLCDLFATAGDHHIRLWSFRRPSKTETASLTYKGCTMGKVSVFPLFVDCL
jgi:hypothetical protein